jgi:DNA-binding CsgD family transcriptional regulator
MTGKDSGAVPDLAGLTLREQEVLRAWLLTESKELVAQQLYVSPSTVRTHLQRIRAKYAATGRPAATKAALVARAVEDGFVSLDEL